MNIQINLQIAVDDASLVPSLDELELWARTAFETANYNKDNEFTARFASSEEVQTLNRTYRNKDYPTNILTFPFEQPEELPLQEGEAEYLGDLVISMDVLKKEAQEQNKTLTEHAAHLIIHGCLHLLGFDHIEDDEAEEMEKLEIEILAKLNYKNPYE